MTAKLPILQVKNLSKHYNATVAVKNISFSVQKGMCLGLLGPNGAGKTTTIEMMEGICTPSTGEILYCGHPITASYAEIIGIQFQSTALQQALTVKETLVLFQRFYTKVLPIDKVVDLCTLGAFIDRDTKVLSGGQRQRLLLALALINDPEIIFLDEPTTGLDPQSRHSFWNLIETIKAEQKTIILTTHYMEEAERLCDEIAIIDNGDIIVLDAPKRLLNEHFQGVCVQLPAVNMTATDFPFPVNINNNVVEFTTNDIEYSLRKLLDIDISITELKITPPNLEDLFLKLTGHTLRA